ncbi:MAG TPA: hypothetical protein VF190_13905 [Rhodothermales bacterium]
MSIDNDTSLLPLSVLAARLNRDTPYRCICRNGGAEIYVGDTRLWFDERSAREVLTAVLFVEDELIEAMPWPTVRGGRLAPELAR